MICVDDVVRRHLGERLHQRLVAVARDIVVDLFRIDVPGVLQHHVNLLVKVIAQVALQFRHRLAAKAVHDRFSMLRLDMLVERLFGINQDQRTSGAQSHATGAAHQDSLAQTPQPHLVSASFSLSECWLRQPVPMQTLISWSNFAFSARTDSAI